jgi:hypothetical protein
MNSNDGLCSRRNPGPNGAGGNVPAITINVYHDRPRSDSYSAARGRNEGPARGDYVITGTYAERLQRTFQRNRSISQRHSMLAPSEFRELPLKLPALLPGPVIHVAGP